VGALFIPGRWCSPARSPTPCGTCRFPATSPVPPLPHPIGGGDGDETSTRIHHIHPSGLLLACSPRMEREPLGLHLGAPHPAVTRDARRGRRQAMSTGLELHLRHRTSIDVFTHYVRPRVAPGPPSPWDSRPVGDPMFVLAVQDIDAVVWHTGGGAAARNHRH
jgi:hypothetical protein